MKKFNKQIQYTCHKIFNILKCKQLIEEVMTHEIKVCMGSSCFARGNLENLNLIENYIKNNNLDAQVELIGALCEEKCASGPHIYIDGKNYDEVDEEKLNKILEVLK